MPKKNIIQIIWEGGVDPGEYHKVEPQIYKSNLDSCLMMISVMTVYNLFGLSTSLFSSALTVKLKSLLVLFCIGIVLIITTTFMIRKKITSHIAINILQFSVITSILLDGILIGIAEPGLPAILYHVILVATQVVFIETPIFSLLIPLAGSTLFLSIAHSVKIPEIYAIDLLDTIVVTTLAIVLGWIQSRFLVKEKINQRKLEEWGNEVYFRSHEDYRMVTQQALETIANIIDAKDKYTKGHSIRVATFSREIARRAGMSPEEQERIFYIGLLHDIGKIGIPDEILNKPDSLTDEEFEIIKKHPQIGNEILQNFTAVEGISEGAKYHHERMDGKGYNNHIQGEDIPKMVRIISVADTYDAITSDRSYRKAFPDEKAIAILRQAAGTQLDPDYIEIAVSMIQEHFSI